MSEARAVLLTKLAAARRAQRAHQRALRAESWEGSAVRVFCYPVDAAIPRFETTVLQRHATMYPEDYANYQLWRYLFQHCVSAASPEQATHCFLPLFLPAYELGGIDLTPTIDNLEFRDSGIPHIVFSSWDTYPRPLARRANPFCRVGRAEDLIEKYQTQFRWLDDRFQLLTYESTIDRLPHDIGVFPVRPGRPIKPASRRRPLLYSFVGTCGYASVAANHVRGGDNQPHWARLIGLNGHHSFVGDDAAARARFGPQASSPEVCKQSVFVLCPAGFGRWTFRVFEALAAGAIPVILSDYYVKPLSTALPWDRFSLTLPEASLPAIDAVLRSLPPRKVHALQQGVMRWQPAFGAVGLAKATLAELTMSASEW